MLIEKVIVSKDSCLWRSETTPYCSFSITQDKAVMENKAKTRRKSFRSSDIAGCKTHYGKKKELKECLLSLELLFLALTKGSALSKRKIRIFRFWVENEEEMKGLILVHELLHGPFKSTEPNEERKLNSSVFENIKVRKFVMIINPKSGRFGSMSIYNNKIRPFLKYGNIEAEEIVTESSKHLVDIGKSLKGKVCDAIVVIGGDGTIHNLINGLFADRDDGTSRLNTPFVVFPGGSGNALCTSIADQIFEESKAENNLYLMLRGHPQNVSLSEIRAKLFNKDGTVSCMNCVSFLSISWGTIADIDIDSEFLRFLGETRYFIYGFIQILKGKKIPAKLYVRGIDKEPKRVEDPFENNLPGDWVNLSNNENSKYMTLISSHLRSISKGFCISKSSFIGDSVIWASIAGQASSRYQLLKLLIESNFEQTISVMKNEPEMEAKGLCSFKQIKCNGVHIAVTQGKLVVDGELKHVGKFIAHQEIIPQTIKVLAL